MTADGDYLSETEADWSTLAEFALPSEPGNERLAMLLVDRVVEALELSPSQRDRLNTAVAEAALNAIEHGNSYQRELPVEIAVAVSAQSLKVTITDQGASAQHAAAPTPDLGSKLAGTQSPRGWGLFLIKSMVDSMCIRESGNQHVIELVLHLERSSEGESEAEGA